jgi:hypothetical protein
MPPGEISGSHGGEYEDDLFQGSLKTKFEGECLDVRAVAQCV